MGKGLTGLALLLAGALVWAYLLTHPFGEAPPAGLVRVWKVMPRDITKVTYQEGNTLVELEPSWGKEEQPYVWMRTERERPAPRRPTEKKAPQELGVIEPSPVVKTEFKGNTRAADTLEDFTELLATRAIGGGEVMKTPAFGLVEPKGTLRVELKPPAAPLELKLGALTYGKQMRYGVTGEDGQVYLFRQALFNRLARAQTSLIDRELFPFPIEDAARIRIVRQGTEREFWRREGAMPEDGLWGDAPDAASSAVGMETLVSNLGRLKAIAFLAAPGGQEAESEVAILEVRAYPTAEGGEPAWLRLFSDGQTGTVASSSHTRTRVRVSQRASKAVFSAAARVMESGSDDAPASGEGG